MAAILGGQSLSQVSRRYNIPDGTIHDWSAHKLVRPRKVDFSRAIVIDQSSVALAITNESNTFLEKAKHSRFSERELLHQIKTYAASIFGSLGYAPIEDLDIETRVANGIRVDLLAKHTDGTYTLAEVKSCGGSALKSRGWLLYGAIGQVLYYAEVLRDVLGLDDEKTNLLIMADYSPDLHFRRAIGQIKRRVDFLNVLPIILGNN